jgi:hypothetical protein
MGLSISCGVGGSRRHWFIASARAHGSSELGFLSLTSKIFSLAHAGAKRVYEKMYLFSRVTVYRPPMYADDERGLNSPPAPPVFLCLLPLIELSSCRPHDLIQFFLLSRITSLVWAFFSIMPIMRHEIILDIINVHLSAYLASFHCVRLFRIALLQKGEVHMWKSAAYQTVTIVAGKRRSEKTGTVDRGRCSLTL